MKSNMNAAANSLKILAFFAHPDDETVFLGGTLAYLASAGAEVHYLCATRGEGGELGDPPICERAQLGQAREEELRCAVASLGGAGLEFLGFKDPEVGPEGELYAFSASLDDVVNQLCPVLERIQPEIILTHGPDGEYGHPAHVQAHQALQGALERLSYVPRAVYAPAWLSRETGEFNPAPGILVDIRPWISRKIAAMQCHRSQHSLFTRHGSARAGRPVTLPEMVRNQEALCRVLPHEMIDADPLDDLLRPIAIALPDRA